MEHFVSCGFLIQSKDKFLLCHPSNLRVGKLEGDKGWGLPKGKIDEGEDRWECALRETKEETNLDLLALSNGSSYPLTIGQTVVYGTEYLTKHQGQQIRKTICIFHAKEDSGFLQTLPISCPSLVENTNIPEMDDFRWVTRQEATKMVTRSILPLFTDMSRFVLDYGN